jgi:dihydrofolate reductase
VKKVIFQMSVSLDGYIEGPKREIGWHRVDDEFNAYAIDMLSATAVMIMGRRIYELMADYWPDTEDNDPIVKKLMNETPKLVFSRTLKSVDWRNARLATGAIADEVARLKRIPGDGLLAVGGNELATAFLEQGLIDELRIILTPIVLGAGKALFEGVKQHRPLTLLSTRTFKSGSVVLVYEPAAR